MKRCRQWVSAFGLLGALSVASPVGAQEQPLAEGPSPRSFHTGVDFYLRPFWGSFVGNSRSAFFARSSTVSGASAAQGEDVVGGGAGVDLGVSYRFRQVTSFGMYYSHQALSVPDTSPLRRVGSDAGGQAWAVGALLRLQGTGWVSPTLDLGLGYAGVEYGANGWGDDRIRAMTARAAAGVSVMLQPLRSMMVSFGPVIGVEGWLPISHEHTPNDAQLGLCAPSGGDVTCEAQVNGRYFFGLDLRVTLPVSYPPQPPPPPPPPPEPVVRFVRVVSQDSAHDSGAEQPEITPTAAYQRLLPSIRHVAVRAPSNCENARVSDATGQAAGVGREILRTNCGVEMAELERRLAMQGFVVTSWTTLASAVESQRLTPTAAAAMLGAQVLFQVNSLERTLRNAGRTMQWEQSYYESNMFGDEGDPVPLSESDRQQLRGFLRDTEARASTGNRLGATLDLNAIDVQSGQSIWFFRWNHVQPRADTQGRVTGLARSVDGGPWMPVVPAQRPTAEGPMTERYATRDTRSESQHGGAMDPEQEQHFALVREAISRFVEEFSPRRVEEAPHGR